MNLKNPRILMGATLLLVLIVTFVPWLGDTLFNTKGEPREALVAVEARAGLCVLTELIECPRAAPDELIRRVELIFFENILIEISRPCALE